MEINRQANGQLILGVFIIAMGVLLLLDRFDVIEVSYLARNFWPVILIVIGVSRLTGGGRRSRRIGDEQ